MTTTKPTIHERMAAILDELPAIGKDAYNPGLKFNYRSVEQMLNELNPLLGKHGVFLLPEVREVRLEVRATKSGSANVAIVTVLYHFVDDAGCEVVATSVGEGQDSGDKAVSKAMTMALKTCLGQTFAISTEDDPDGESVQISPGASLHAARAEQAGREAAGGQGTGPAAPPAEDPLAKRRTNVYELAKALDPGSLSSLKEKMAAAGIGMDFAKHGETEIKQLEDWLCPL